MKTVPKSKLTQKISSKIKVDFKNKTKKRKTTIMHTTRGLIPMQEELERIPIVSSYKYLGQCLQSTLTMQTQLDNIPVNGNSDL